MGKIIICSIVFILNIKSFYSCINKAPDNNIQAFRLIYNIPVFTPDSNFEIRNTYDVFYCKDIIIYKFNYRFDSLFNGNLVFQEWRSNYFVFHKDSLFGHNYYLKPDLALKNARLSVDSMLKKNSFESLKFDTLLTLKPDSSYFDTEGNLLKIFNNPPPNSSQEKYDLYFYYTKKLKGVKETFSRKMDNVNNMKLFKIRIVAKGAYYEEYKTIIPEREYLYEMEEIRVENEKEIMSYFNRYKEHMIN